jgi:Protein of unknown function (DUF507)
MPYNSHLARRNVYSPARQALTHPNLKLYTSVLNASRKGLLDRMHYQREYVAYMAKQVLKRLSTSGLVQYDQPEYVTEVMTQVMLDELGVEDRLNEDVRKILEEHADEMKRAGASYEEMFKKVKKQLAHDRKVVL